MNKLLGVKVSEGMEGLIDLDVIANAIQECMEYGEKTHPHDSWREVDEFDHAHHAIDHIARFKLIKAYPKPWQEVDGFGSSCQKREIQHAITRLAMLYVLIGERDTNETVS